MSEFLNSCSRNVQRLVPRHCLLCGAALAAESDDNPVCAGCDADLPRLPPARCAVCAAPLPAGAVCGRCLAHPPRFARVAAPLAYAYPADALIQAFKYGGRLALAGPLARWLSEAVREPADVVVPMPLAPARLRSRGFNQAHEIARRVAASHGVPLASSMCHRVRDTTPQAALPWSARAGNVRGAFVCEADLAGLHVAVVDDVMTTGATLNELARTLLRAGAREVSAWVVARALRRS